MPVSRVAAFRGSCSRLASPRPRASDDSRRFTSTVMTMTISSSSGVVMKWINLAASAGSNSGGIKVRVTRMGGGEGSGVYAGYAEQVLADVDGHLILSGAASETILPQWVPAGLWRRGMELEGHWGEYWFFPPG